MGMPGKPRIAVFTLGGTIAMQAAPGEGAAPALSASDLLAAVLGLDDADVRRRGHRKPGQRVTTTNCCSMDRSAARQLPA